MNVQRAEILAEFLLLLRANVFEVLVPKHDDTALGNEQSKLILLNIGELRQLKTLDLGSNAWRELGDGDIGVIGIQQVGLRWVGIKTTIVDLEWFSWRENGGVVVHGEIIHIFGLFNHVVWSQYLAEPR
jgi:hypothetical protein